MSAVTAEAVGSVDVSGTDPNAAGGSVGTERVQAESSRVVHPDQAPATPAGQEHDGGAPESAPAEGSTGQESPDDWKASLDPDTQKQVDRVITGMRQKDTERVRELEARVQQTQWAEQLAQMAKSTDPTVRQQAAQMLRGVLTWVETPTGKAAEPSVRELVQGVDWTNVDAIAPGLPKVVQHLVQQNEAYAQMLGETRTQVEATTRQQVEAAYNREVAQVEDYAKQHGLSYDNAKVDAVEQRYGLTDHMAAFKIAYADEMLAAGKKQAQNGLERRRAASLPGGTAGGGAPSRPKFRSMQESWEYTKRQAGITGPYEYRG